MPIYKRKTLTKHVSTGKLVLNKTIDCEGMLIIINAISIKHTKKNWTIIFMDVCVCVFSASNACAHGAQEWIRNRNEND